MNFEKLTDRSKGFFQSAQSLALREGHQRLTPEHLLKVLLDDSEGLAAGLIARAGGRPEDALARVEQALAKMPKVSGAGARRRRSRRSLATATSLLKGCSSLWRWRRMLTPQKFSRKPAQRPRG
jgi:ATP-dependent Clp protease ATP-binding subunit ClpB